MIKKSSNFLLALMLGVFLLLGSLQAREIGKTQEDIGLNKVNLTAAGVAQTMSNIGNWGFWVNQHGQTGHDPFTGSSGGYYPRGISTAIYMDGFIWGGWKGGIDRANPAGKLFVGGIGYRIGTIAGWVQADGTAIDPDNERVGIYRIRNDWRTLTINAVRADAAELFNVGVNDVSDSDIQSVIDQYMDDWKNWPVDLGAPYYDVDGDGTYNPVLDPNGYPVEGTLVLDDGTEIVGNDYPGVAKADQVAWLVVNDLNASRTQNHSGSDPMGFELQITLWAYNQPGATLGQIVFKRYKLINKSPDVIDSMFVAQYSDPDIGDYGDDVVGCDVDASLHFAYNGGPVDGSYAPFNMAPPAAGFDFFQGPIVDGAPTDTAIFGLKKIAGKKNLPMTSFGYFAAGAAISDPDMGVYTFTTQWYNMLNGYIPTDDLENPSSYLEGSGPNAGNASKFPLWGDPETDPTGANSDIDGQGSNLSPGDRRMFAASGPFTMQPGDEQEIVVALLGGLGANNYNSVTDLKATDKVAQNVYDGLFSVVPKPPATPDVQIAAFGDAISLNWGHSQAAVKATEQEKIINYEFEGYNVYQLATANSKISDASSKRIATFDLVNNVRIIKSATFVPAYGTIVDLPVQFGTDNGVKRNLTITQDNLLGKPLLKGTTYYFAVTAYNYDPSLVRDRALESSAVILSATVQDPVPGTRYEGTAGELLEVEKGGGASDGLVEIEVVDPSATTGHDYQVVFVEDADSNSATFGDIVWELHDVTDGTTVLSKQTQQADLESGDYPIVDGLVVKVSGPPAGVKAMVQVANAGGPLGPDDFDTAGEPYGGNNVWYSLSAPSDGNRFYVGAGGGAAGTTSDKYDRYARSIANANAHDFEWRFKDNTTNSIYLWWYDDDTYDAVPFEFWDVGIGTYDDASDDVRMLTGGYSGGTATGTGGFTFDYEDQGFGYPATDWVYTRVPMDDQGNWDAFYSDVTSGTLGYVWWDHSYEVLARLIIADFGGGGTLPEAGTVIRFITNKLNQTSTYFDFTAPAVTADAEVAKQDIEKINVFPNPYYASNPLENDRFGRFVTFTHLPQKATVRIFNLAGVQVRKLDKDGPSQFLQWDLNNESTLPVASGLYVAYVDMPDLGKTKTLKVMVIQSEQILEYY